MRRGRREPLANRFRVDELKAEIQEIVDRETRAWDTRDVDLLLSVFHPDMVWPWPRTPRSHDPMEWVLEWGCYDAERWGRSWRELFETHELVRNERETRKIEVSRATGRSPWWT